MRIVSYNVRYFGHATRGLASTAGAKSRIAKSIATLAELPDVVRYVRSELRPAKEARTA